MEADSMTQRAPKNRPRQPCGTRHMPGAVALLLACASAGAATPTMTIAEGKITVFSGGAAYLPKAGLQLRTCDVIRTGPKALVQIEYDDGGRIVLGPDSRLVVDLPLGGDPVVGPHYLLSGWVKLTVPKRDKAAAYRIDTPQFNLATDSGVAALRVGEHDAAAAAPKEAFKVASKSVVLRRSPSSSSSAVRDLDKGDMVYPSGAKEDMWWEVEDENGNIGWVENDDLKPVQ